MGSLTDTLKLTDVMKLAEDLEREGVQLRDWECARSHPETIKEIARAFMGESAKPFDPAARIEDSRDKRLLKVRTYNVLHKGEIVRFVDLLSITIQDLMEVRHCTAREIEDTRTYLERQGYVLPYAHGDWLEAVHKAIYDKWSEATHTPLSKVAELAPAPFAHESLAAHGLKTVAETYVALANAISGRTHENSKTQEALALPTFRTLGAIFRLGPLN